MNPTLGQPELGRKLKAERRRRQLSLRDLADEIDVSFNTLSRVERGHLPDFKNYERIVIWLEAPGDSLFDQVRGAAPTPEIIAKHLHSDSRLKPEDATKIASLVQDLYSKLANPTPTFAAHLRSGQTFLPEVGSLLAEVLQDMSDRLAEEGP